MPRFKLLIEYAGTRYSGWQIQKNARTVQGEIDRAVREVSKRHEFELYTDLPPESLRRQLNDELPADIHIRAIEKVPHRFHARHDAVARCYLYQISRRRTAFGKPFVWWIREPLDIDAMRKAATAFVGMQDFSAFTADDPDQKSTRVLVDAVEIGESGSLILIRVQGSHFLWKMVRRMVGVLAAVGRGELKPSDASRLLDTNSSQSQSPAALAAPAAGLFLEAVLYEGDRPPDPIQPLLTIDP
jgi:tRNA pseudouridine38-40 synthase